MDESDEGGWRGIFTDREEKGRGEGQREEEQKIEDRQHHIVVMP